MAKMKDALVDELGKQKLREAREHFERVYLEALMEEHEGNVTQGAVTAGITRNTLYKLLHRIGVDPDEFREE